MIASQDVVLGSTMQAARSAESGPVDSPAAGGDHGSGASRQPRSLGPADSAADDRGGDPTSTGAALRRPGGGGGGGPCARCERLSAELDEARAALGREAAARERLEAAAAALEGECGALRADRDGLAAELDASRAAEARLREQVAALEASSAAVQAERDNLKLFGRRARAELKQLKEAGEELRAERDALLAARAGGGGGGGGSEQVEGASDAGSASQVAPKSRAAKPPVCVRVRAPGAGLGGRLGRRPPSRWE